MRPLNPFDCAPLRTFATENPLTIVDVGAAGGIEQIWSAAFQDGLARGYGFEAYPPNFDKLKPTSSITYFSYALSDTIGEAEFFGSSTQGALSRRHKHEQRGHVFEKISVRTETLANLRSTGVLPELDAIKIDVEEHEIAVLKGADDYLNEALYVKAEFTFDAGKGNSFSDIDARLKKSGLRLFEIASNYTTARSLAGGDVLYMKDISRLLKSGDNSAALRPAVLKLIIISLIGTYYEYAYICARQARDAGVLDAGVAGEIEDFCLSAVYVPILIGRFPGKHQLAWIIFNLSRLFSGYGTGESLPKDNRLQKSTRMWTRSPFVRSLFAKRIKDFWNRIWNRRDG